MRSKFVVTMFRMTLSLRPGGLCLESGRRMDAYTCQKYTKDPNKKNIPCKCVCKQDGRRDGTTIDELVTTFKIIAMNGGSISGMLNGDT